MLIDIELNRSCILHIDFRPSPLAFYVHVKQGRDNDGTGLLMGKQHWDKQRSPCAPGQRCQLLALAPGGFGPRPRINQ